MYFKEIKQKALQTFQPINEITIMMLDLRLHDVSNSLHVQQLELHCN